MSVQRLAKLLLFAVSLCGSLKSLAALSLSLDNSLIKGCEAVLTSSRVTESVAAPTLFSQINFGPEDGQPIVFYSTPAPWVGDHLLLSATRLGALHRLFPKSKIYFISSFARMFQETSWFQPLSTQLPLSQISETAGQNSFWFTQSSNPVEFLFTNRLSGLHVEEVSSFNIISQPIFSFKDRESQKFKSPFPTELHNDFNSQYNVYHRVGVRLKMLFGSSDGLTIPPEIFLPPNSDAFVKEFLRTRFPQGPENKFVVINLNTAGDWKVNVIRGGYTWFVSQLINKIKEAIPDTNILITQPEPQFGSYVRDEVAALVEKNRAFVGFMPEERNFWQALIQKSNFVISQDSGFMHIALIMKPELDVFALATSTASQPWTKPGQPFGFYNSMNDLFRWIDSRKEK